MGRPKEHDERTAEALVDAAEKILARSGPDAVSVRAVARLVGVTTRAVYASFGSKAGLIEALSSRGYGLLTANVRAAPTSDDPIADLVQVGSKAFRSFAIERPHLFRLTFERPPSEISKMATATDAALAAYRELAQRIERVLLAGHAQGFTTAEVGFMFHALCAGLATNEIARQPPPTGVYFWRHVPDLDTETLWTNAIRGLIVGLSPRAKVRRAAVAPARRTSGPQRKRAPKSAMRTGRS